MKLVILFATLGAILISGTPLKLEVDNIPSKTDSTPAIVYPQTVGGYQARRGGALTNGELLRRGQKINSRPRKLHQSAKTRRELVKRITNVPSSAPNPPGSGANTYTFRGCYFGGNFEYGSGSNSPFQPYTTPEKLANDCSVEQDKITGLDGARDGFIISNHQADRGYDCETSIGLRSDAVEIPCSSSPNSFAYYSL